MERFCLLACSDTHLQLSYRVLHSYILHRDGTAHGGWGPPTPISKQKPAPKICPEDNLMEAILHLRLPLPHVKLKANISSQHCQLGFCHAYHTYRVILPLDTRNALQAEQGLEPELWTVQNNSNSRKKNQEGHRAPSSYTETQANFPCVDNKAKPNTWVLSSQKILLTHCFVITVKDQGLGIQPAF